MAVIQFSKWSVKMKETDEKKIEQLVPLTIRFPKEVMEVIDFTAKGNNLSKAEIVRISLDDKLSSYLKNLHFVDPVQGEEIRSILGKTMTEIECVRRELHRIGVNFNQTVKLEHIKRRYQGERLDYRTLKLRINAEQNIKKASKELEPEQFMILLERFNIAVQEGGEKLCRILE